LSFCCSSKAVVVVVVVVVVVEVVVYLPLVTLHTRTGIDVAKTSASLSDCY